MKFKVLSFLSLIIILASCSRDEQESKPGEFSFDSYPQEWDLFKMVAGMSGQIYTDDELELEEEYTFREDGTFTKVRLSAAETVMATGTFEKQQEEDPFVLILTFNDDSQIISSCGSENRELLFQDRENNILGNMGWSSCDGPSFYYKTRN